MYLLKALVCPVHHCLFCAYLDNDKETPPPYGLLQHNLPKQDLEFGALWNVE